MENPTASPRKQRGVLIDERIHQIYETNDKNNINEFGAGQKRGSLRRKDSLAHAHRKFYDVPQLHHQYSRVNSSSLYGRETLFNYVNNSVIGKNKIFSGPFGLRKVTYCDYTASGRSLQFIEDYIRDEVLPEYGNTHTTTTVTSLQTTLFRHEARDIIRNAVNASEHDAVIFVGSGCTAAVHKLIHGLDFQTPPVVFVGPYEHHSNILPWREMEGAEVIRIQETGEGLVDQHHLKFELERFKQSGREMIGCFAAASNVSGILADVIGITVLLHKYGAYSVWDYATAGPYVKVDMNPVTNSADQPYAYKDAVFISPHKFVGGVQTPGLLIAKKACFRNPVPAGVGGGTVFFVRREAHRYLQDLEAREEGGTPAIVESIRAGMTFQLKESMDPEMIMVREEKLHQRAKEAWLKNPNMLFLGNMHVDKLPIYSFLVRHAQSGMVLHHNFVVALLNDLFGLQTRGGCACAGPYGEDLLGMAESTAIKLEEALMEDSRLDRTHLRRQEEHSDLEMLRPGFVRLNLPFFMPDETVEFVFNAVNMVAEHGWKLLPQYTFNPETGEWRQKDHKAFKDRKWLGHISYEAGKMGYMPYRLNDTGPLPESYEECLDKAMEIFNSASKVRVHLGDQTQMFARAKDLRWFLLPSEAYMWLQNPQHAAELPKAKMPFYPVKYPRSDYTRDYLSESPVMAPSPSEMSRPTTIAAGTFQRKGSAVESDPSSSAADVRFELGGDESDTSRSTSVSRQESMVEDVPLESPRVEDPAPKQNGTASPPNGSNTSSPAHCPLKKQNAVSDSDIPGEKKKPKWHVPSRADIFTPTVKAIQDFDMLKDGDRVLVCLSGGKDSLSLLHTLHQFQYYAAKKKGINFEIGAVTIDPQTPSYDPSPLKGYLKDLGVPYFYEEQCIMEAALNLPYECASICSYCSRMKRGRIYTAARREGYNVLAMGQHLDDLAESFLMSFFFNGILRTMKASYTINKEDLRVIRPFVYVREKDLRHFAQQSKLPVIAENCPACFEAPKERHRMKQLLASQEVIHPRLFFSIVSSLKPLMAINKTGVNVKTLLGLTAKEGEEEEKEKERDIDEE